VLTGLLAALLAAAAFLPGSALGVEPRPLVESFGTDGTSGTTFERPGALAFDQGNKRLYALDLETQRIHGFNASTPGTHTPLGGSYPLEAPGAGFSDDIGVDSSTHNLYFASVGANELFGFDESGAALSGFPVGGHNFPCGVATDSAGDIWVAEGNEGLLKKYSPAGALLDTISIGGEPCDVSIDSEDNIYVAFFFGATKKFTAASGYADSTEIDSETSVAVSVDQSTDEVYVVHPNPAYVAVYEADGSLLYEFGSSISLAEFSGIAIDEGTEEAYVADAGNHLVHVFGPPLPLPTVTTGGADGIAGAVATIHGTVNPQGQALEDCFFEYGETTSYGSTAPCVPAAASIPADSSDHAVSADLSGLEAATTYHYRLVASNAIGEKKGPDRAFVSSPDAPEVGEARVEAVSASGATLSAEINPHGGDTTYHVEYGTTSAYGQSTPESAPIGFPTDVSFHEVSVHVGGLQPGIAYHFRFVATSTAGTAEGDDATFATYPLPQSFGACPNDPLRTGAGAALPDCRGYEQATPIDKHGANAQASIGLVAASSSGDRVTYFINGGLPTSGGSSDLFPFIASRGPSGWSSDGLLPATDPQFTAQIIGWNDDLSAVLDVAPGPGNVGKGLYLRDSNANYQLELAGPSNFFLALAGFAADPSHLVFETKAGLLPGTTSGKNYPYDLDHGGLSLVSRIPAGSATSCDDEAGPACVIPPNGAFAGPYNWGSFSDNERFGGAEGAFYTLNAISRDGAKTFFTTADTAQLYVREDGVRTKEVSASQRTIPDPNGEKPAVFLAATPDGSKVFFASCEKLTDDSTAVSTAVNRCVPSSVGSNQQGMDLYSYDTATGDLADLTVDHEPSDPLGAEVVGVLGASDDGSYVYFVANGALASGASSGDCPSSSGGVLGSCSIYVVHNGAIKFIARVGKSENSNWTAGRFSAGGSRSSRVSPDGQTLLFRSRQNLDGYDNVPLVDDTCGNKKDPCSEFFRYRAPDNELTCISCNPTGLPPRGNAALAFEGNFLAGGLTYRFLTRNLSSDGNRVFFESKDPLVLSDTNGAADVYEWEAKGTGSCESENQNGGCLYLLSTGTSPVPSMFLDASADGDHVFLLTDKQLVPNDEDPLIDVYDAGVGAGLASQHSLAPPTCASTACQSSNPPSSDQTPSSAALSGPGNVHERSVRARRCPKGRHVVRRAGRVRCHKVGKPAKQRKRHSNRGGAK
jgi:hypothetical protein